MGDRDGSVLHAETTCTVPPSTSSSMKQDRQKPPPSPAQFSNHESHARDKGCSLSPNVVSPTTHNELLAQPHGETMQKLDIPAAKFVRPVEDPSFLQMDTALRYGTFLEISHEGDYIMACHEDKFANDHIYDKGNGLLPSVLCTAIADFLPKWISWANKER